MRGELEEGVTRKVSGKGGSRKGELASQRGVAASELLNDGCSGVQLVLDGLLVGNGTSGGKERLSFGLWHILLRKQFPFGLPITIRVSPRERQTA